MDSSSDYEKTRMEVVVENTRNHFENTLDKLPFELEILALKLVEKITKIVMQN